MTRPDPTHAMNKKTNYTNPYPLVIKKKYKNIKYKNNIERSKCVYNQQEHLAKLLILRHLQQICLKVRVPSASKTTCNLVKQNDMFPESFNCTCHCPFVLWLTTPEDISYFPPRHFSQNLWQRRGQVTHPIHWLTDEFGTSAQNRHNFLSH